MGAKHSYSSGATRERRAVCGTQADAEESKQGGSGVGGGGESAPLRKTSSGWRLRLPQMRWPRLLRLLRHGYSDLVNAVIRPPRAQYGLRDLGPVNFTLGGRCFERHDLRVPGARGLELACSWWQPAAAERLAEQLPCVVYMHGNASCRLEALDTLQPILQMGLMLFAFDFAGCGQSQGDNITLGFYEKDDAEAIVEFLRKSGSVSTIAFWGRSMGAATALLHGHRDPSIAAMVLDSPFSSLEQLTNEVIDRAQLKHKPRLLIRAGVRMIRSTIMKKTGLDILRLKPIENVNKCYIPAIFVAGKDDAFIPPHHTGDIFEQYAGDKDLIMVAGGHNSQRPPSFMYTVSLFFYYTLCVPAGLTNARPGLQPGWVPQRQTQDAPERARQFIRAQLQRVTGAVEAPVRSNGAAAVGDDITRLVGAATSRTQSTLPDRGSAAEGLRSLQGRV